MNTLLLVLMTFLAGIVFFAIFGLTLTAKKRGYFDDARAVLSGCAAIFLIFLSGAISSNGRLLYSRYVADKNLYFVCPITNVTCLVPAKLNTLTGVPEPCGRPAYYADLRIETNAGPVVAVIDKDGIALKPFPLKETPKKERAEK